MGEGRKSKDMTAIFKNLRRWFSRAKPAPVKLVHRSAHTLTLAEWQSSESLVAEGQRLLADHGLRLALDMLRHESPVNYGLPVLGVAATDRIVHQARTDGYHLCLNNLEALGTLNLAEQPVEATFVLPESDTAQ